ncbi:S-layer homology domain-containing protein [Paenibacillus sp. N3/727]|uniref:S-layer homology domain-containing protein n=1 Tax=Paenibacillus sp. N3/727 TaxID=2925845 RepID=UPI001F53738F|nr:S-layer homology domain-containing protein [Paenibacillus sp. N3/727]UNK18694.1 S-layer homology domain-containing protein [Paenibacillus sp. N3/727]
MKLSFYRLQKLLLLPAVMILLSMLSITKAHAADVQQLTEQRTKQDILDKWQQYKPMDTGSSYMAPERIYLEQPSVKAPYTEGKVKPEYIEDGIRAVNFVRYLSGLPDDVTADESLAKQQQAAALINGLNQRLSHSPSMPSGMESSLFTLGSGGAKTSNLYYGSRTFYANVLGYMSDSDKTNIDRVGHRRWIMNPQMKKTMFGMVHAENNVPYASMYAMNKDRSASEVQYDYISWPSAGYFPQEVFDEADAWSVSLNPEKYDRNRIENIKVKMTRVRDGKEWSFDGNDRDPSGKYFNVQTSYYGIPFAIIFRPDQIGQFTQDDVFNIQITGLYGVGGNEAQVEFKTVFFKMMPGLLPRYDIEIQKGETLQMGLSEGLQTNGNTFKSGDSNIVTIDMNGQVKAVAKGTTWISVNDYWDLNSKVHITVTGGQALEKVSNWALADYKKAKGNGIIGWPFDHSYQQPITRVQFTEMSVHMIETMLGRNLYFDVAEVKSPFKDVDEWTVTWASQSGIINGTSAQSFSPNSTITREQAAALILNLYLKTHELKGEQASVGSVGNSLFMDDSKISSWAKSQVYQAIDLSLMKGTGKNQFNPKGELTYEQTYVLLQNCFEKLMK